MHRCGNEQTGILEFPILGGLTVGESQIISQMSGSQESSLAESARLAQQIAKAESISLSEAFGVIEKALSGTLDDPKQIELVERHQDVVDKLRIFFAQQGVKTQAATVTALIRCRLNLPDWDDMAHLPQALFDDIWDFAQSEQDQENQEPAARPTEEELGKPQGASKNGKQLTTTASVGS
jgi:sulfur relay (sulfurtransferase) DsrC/TusE family protein